MRELWSHQKALELERELAIRRAQRWAALQGSGTPDTGRGVTRLLAAAFKRPARRVMTFPGWRGRGRRTGLPIR
jgi:hypothetical protein